MVVIKRLREEEEELHIALFRGCFCRIVEVASGVDENLRKEMFQILARWSGYAGNSRGAVDIEMYSSEMSAFLGRSVAGKITLSEDGRQGSRSGPTHKPFISRLAVFKFSPLQAVRCSTSVDDCVLARTTLPDSRFDFFSAFVTLVT